MRKPVKVLFCFSTAFRLLVWLLWMWVGGGGLYASYVDALLSHVLGWASYVFGGVEEGFGVVLGDRVGEALGSSQHRVEGLL